MKYEKDVTIVIPVYNGGAYFKKCLDQVIAQSYDHAKMEVIIVDNGSTDGSSDLADDYARRDAMFKVFHQKNSGTPASPRNRGIENASGEYIFFNDADDYLGSQAIEKMLLNAHAWNSDILCPKQGVSTRANKPQSMYKKNNPKADLYDTTVARTLGPWKLFRTSLLLDNNIRFHDDCYLEDAPFTLEAMFCAQIISAAADYDYYYLIKRNDGNNLTSDNTKLVGAGYVNITNCINAVRYITSVLGNYADLQKAKKNILPKVYGYAVNMIERILKTRSSERGSALTEIRQALNPYYYEDLHTDYLSLYGHMMIATLMKLENPLSVLEEMRKVPANINNDRYRFSLINNHLYCSFHDLTSDASLVSIDVSGVGLEEFHITQINWKKETLTITGHLVYPTESLPKVYLGLSLFSRSDETILIDFNIQNADVVDVVNKAPQKKVNRFVLVAEIDFSKLRDYYQQRQNGKLIAEDITARWDYFLMFPSMGKRIRIGSRREAQVFSSYVASAYSSDNFIYIPHETAGYKNLSLLQFPDTKDVSMEPFVKISRRYPFNRLLHSLLRNKKNDAALNLIEHPEFLVIRESNTEIGVAYAEYVKDGEVLESVELKNEDFIKCAIDYIGAESETVHLTGFITPFIDLYNVLYSKLVISMKYDCDTKVIAFPLKINTLEKKEQGYEWAVDFAAKSIQHIACSKDKAEYHFHIALCVDGLYCCKLIAKIGNLLNTASKDLEDLKTSSPISALKFKLKRWL